MSALAGWTARAIVAYPRAMIPGGAARNERRSSSARGAPAPRAAATGTKRWFQKAPLPGSRWPEAVDTQALSALAGDQVKLMYEACRNGIAAENQLVSFRLTWAITLSSGFLTAEAFMLNALLSNGGGGSGFVAHWLGSLTVLLSLIAAWFCRRTRAGVAAALDQIDYLRQSLDAIAAKCLELGLPRPHGSRSSFQHGHRTAEMISFALFTLWALIGVSAGSWLVSQLVNQPIDRRQLDHALGVAAVTALILAVGWMRPARFAKGEREPAPDAPAPDPVAAPVVE